VDDLDMHQNRHKGQLYTDFLLAQKKSINQNVSAWIYTNRHFTETYPGNDHSSIKAMNALSEFCIDVGIQE
jgi:hypothetical protein